jgi:hypothetical protein
MIDTSECPTCSDMEWEDKAGLLRLKRLRTRLDQMRQNAEHTLLNDDPSETSREFLAGMTTGVGMALDAVNEEAGEPTVKRQRYFREVVLREGPVIKGAPELLREDDAELMAQVVQESLRDGQPLSLNMGDEGQWFVVAAKDVLYFQVRPVEEDQ